MLLLLLRLLLDAVLLGLEWLFVEFARREGDDGKRRSGMPILLYVVGVGCALWGGGLEGKGRAGRVGWAGHSAYTIQAREGICGVGVFQKCQNAKKMRPTATEG